MMKFIKKKKKIKLENDADSDYISVRGLILKIMIIQLNIINY